ncbi:hypothetical protein PYW08_004054 [Mythimna loreyi]|uniref:Uncharacterized protein n=1 Tax=Mythimna loreyi TaxID=667449 RepID=A0ACC2QYK9_9NEOP|nr:hypothetical protein PYW08_004054 [Mythimna loreyi]
MLAVIALVQALQFAAAMYFHEPSFVLVQDYGAENYTEFGFSMAYMSDSETLVVGGPNATRFGQLYSCETEQVKGNRLSCGTENIEYSDSDYHAERFPDQRFHLGASVVAAHNFYFTCAPLWTTYVTARNKNTLTKVEDAYGTCFFQNNSETTRYRGLLENFIKPTRTSDIRKHRRSGNNLQLHRFAGGIGWSTLIDETNNLLLIAKSSNVGDFSYLPLSEFSSDVNSLADNKANIKIGNYPLKNLVNIGFGLTAGKFFSNETLYAYNALKKDMEGLISFLKYKRSSNILIMVQNVVLESHDVATMFGYTLSAADLTYDERDELLVGAPAQSDDECYECGALHIYIGGDMHTINEPYRLRTIFGTVQFGRFGSAIVTKDLDDDGKLELIVSAPYENHGSGAIYILSGVEVCQTLFESQDFKSIQLSDLKLTQKIQKASYRTLGFSLQIIEDIDDNGCDELAAGAPGSNSVLIFKCVRKITVEISARLLEQFVREQDSSFTVEVCASVQYPMLPENIVGNVTFENSVFGEAAVVEQQNTIIDIFCDTCFNITRKLCDNVTVSLKEKGAGDYNFKTKAKLQNIYLANPNTTVFNESWVEASLKSKLDASLDVYRRCNGDDCKPQLFQKLLWSGSNPYLLGSSASENVTIVVENQGHEAYSACVKFKVYGADISIVGCQKDENKEYTCYLPSPMKRETNHSINFKLSLSEPTNLKKKLRVNSKLYENCDQKEEEDVKYNMTKLTVDYELTWDGIFTKGDTHRINITEKQILDNATIYDHYEYSITNNGNISWSDFGVTITMYKKPFINSFNITNENCTTKDDKSARYIMHYCQLVLLRPNTTYVVIGTTEILAGRLNAYRNGTKLEIQYKSNLTPPSESAMRVSHYNKTISVTTITIQKELPLATKKWLIALIAGIFAFILLAILAFILYKVGFFRRKQKQKLIVQKESIRRKSVRRNTHASAMDGPAAGLQIEVDDDDAFVEARPVTAKDNVGLVKDD